MSKKKENNLSLRFLLANKMLRFHVKVLIKRNMKEKTEGQTFCNIVVSLI